MRSDLYHLLLGKLESIKADSIVLENANLTFIDLKSKVVRVIIEGFSLRFSGVAIDSLAENDSTRVLFSKDLAIHCNQFELPLKNKIYKFMISGLDYNTVSNHLHTDLIRLETLIIRD